MNNVETVSFWPTSNRHNGFTDTSGKQWVPRMKDFKEKRRIHVARLMADMGVSEETATLMFQTQMEKVDDEAILSI